MDRRKVVQTAGIAITGLTAGCTTDAEDARNPVPENETTVAETESGTPTTDCTERPKKVPDLTIDNNGDTNADVEVTIKHTTDDDRDQTEYYHGTFDVRGFDTRIVRDIFEYDALSAEEWENTTYTAIAEANGARTKQHMTAVAVDPYLLGITVTVTSDGIGLKTWHVDPATAENWCPTPTVN